MRSFRKAFQSREATVRLSLDGQSMQFMMMPCGLSGDWTRVKVFGTYSWQRTYNYPRYAQL